MAGNVASGFDISGWQCDRKTKAFAVKAADFLSEFVDHHRRAGMSETGLRRLRSSAWEVGYVVSRRGFFDRFTPDIFSDPEAIIDIQRRRAHFDLTESFRKTCRMLAGYVEELTARKK